MEIAAPRFQPVRGSVHPVSFAIGWVSYESMGQGPSFHFCRALVLCFLSPGSTESTDWILLASVHREEGEQGRKTLWLLSNATAQIGGRYPSAVSNHQPRRILSTALELACLFFRP